VRKPACFIVVALLAAACNSATKAANEQPAPVASFPVTINGVTINEQPQRIVSLSPTATEMLFAIDAGVQVIAVDDQSNYPADAPKTDLSGFEPNVEAIAGHQPDLVVFANDLNDLAAGLDKVGIPGLLHAAAATLDDTYTQIEQLGLVTGHPAEAAELIDDMKAGIDEITASLPSFDVAPTYYHELDQTYFSVTSSTFIGGVYALLGLENIADPADTQGSGYPQLSAEAIIDADPDLIFLADTKCCGQSASTVAARPGWDKITAVRNGGVVLLDDDIASRWGPRVVEFLSTVADALKELEAAA